MLISTLLARAGQRGANAQGLGRSRGGLSTQIHAAGDALGLLVRLIASPGQRNDIACAHELIDGFQALCTIADKSYDVDHLIDKIVDDAGRSRHSTEAKPKRSASLRHSSLQGERNIIERFFSKLKQFRRVATRYDKLLATSWAS